MALDRLLETLEARFDKPVIRSLIAACRNHPLLWKELSLSDLPEEWENFANADPEKWSPGILSLALSYPDVQNWALETNKLATKEALEQANKVLEAIRLTGLEPANLKDAASLSLLLLQYRNDKASWQGLSLFLGEGKTTLASWKTAFLALPFLHEEAFSALKELILKPGKFSDKEVAAFLVDLLLTQPIDEKKQYEFLSKSLDMASLSLQVEVLGQLRGSFDPAFIELLAASFLINKNRQSSPESQASDRSIEDHQNLALLSQYAGKTSVAREELDKAYVVIRHNQALQLRRMALEFEPINTEEARRLWEQVLELEPENDAHRREYAEFLLKQNEPNFALDLINQNPDESTTALLALRYPELREQTDSVTEVLDNVIQRKNLPSLSTRYVAESDNFKAAEYAFSQKKYNIASDFIRKALKEKPNDIEIIRLAARIDQRLANLDEAINSSALLAMFEPDNKANNRELARLYQQTQQHDKALEVYENQIFEQARVEREDFLNYSEIAIKAGKAELAIPIAENYLAKDQLDGEALVLLCRALIASGRKSEAMELLERASAVAPEKPTSWLALARIWIELGDREQALLALRKAKAALPNEPKILTSLGKLYFDNGETTDAIAALRQANQLDPQDVTTARLLAEAWLKQGYITEAWEVLAVFEDDYASDPELALSLGKVAFANQDLSTAQKMLRFAWHSLKREDALTSYANTLLQINEKHPGSNQEEMAQLLEAIQTQDLRTDDELQQAILLADLKAANGHDEEAYSSYLKLLDEPRAKMPVFHHHLHSHIGKTAGKLGLTDIALASLQEAMLVNPDNIETRRILAKTYLDANLNDEAFNTARSALQIAPSDVDNILWFSAFMNQQDNHKETIQVLKDAIHLRPDNESLYLTLARTYADLNDVEETKTTLNKMLTLESITTKDYIDVANLYLTLGQTDEASSVILKAISNNPDPDFEETKDLVYSVLRLDNAEAAHQLVLNLKENIGSHPCYPILLSDVQVANNEFIAALENLNEFSQKVEFASDEDCFSSQSFEKGNQDFAPYNKAGFYYRLAQVERVTGDLLAAQKHADQAQKEDPGCRRTILLQAGLALSLQNDQKLELALDYLNPESDSSENSQGIVQILALESAINQDYQKLGMLWDYFVSKQAPSLFQQATAALMHWQQSDKESCQQALTSIRRQLSESDRPASTVSKLFEQVWANLMTFLAAWQAQDWRLANESIRKALQTVRLNPVANRLLAAYLSDNYRQRNNAMLLHITRHAPELYTADDPLGILEDQIALAGRYLPPSSLLPVLKVGQAIFGGHWNDDQALEESVLNPIQAAGVLSVLVNREQINKIMTAFGDQPEVLEQKAILNLHNESNDSAEIAGQLLEKDADNPVLKAIKAFALRNDPEKAIEAIEDALAIWPDEPEWHVFASNMYQDAKDYPLAASHLEDALQIVPKSAHYWQLLGDVKLLEKDYHAAKDYFGKASDLFPNNPDALNSLAKINQQLGEHQIAIQCWQKAHQLNPENPVYQTSIAQSHLARKEFEQTIQLAEDVLQNHPSNEQAFLLIASAQMQSGKISEALHTIQEAKKLTSDPIPFDLLEIEILSQTKPTKALQAAQQLADTNPDNPLVLNRLANIQIEAGLLDKARSNLENSLSIDDSDPDTLIYLGMIARQKGQLDQAIACLSQAIKNDPSKIEAYLEMGQTYQDRREVTNAIEIYHKAIDIVEKDPRPYIQASAAYKESRDYRNAEFMLRQAAQLSPSDQSIRRQLAAIVALNLVNNLQEAPKRK